MEEIISLNIALTDEELLALRGGKADITAQTPEQSKSGDGAKFACCIEIEF